MALRITGDNLQVSGRTSGNVIMKNGRERGFSVPKNVINKKTGDQKAALQLWSTLWKDLVLADSSIAEAWQNFQMLTSDRFGQPVYISGKAAWVRLNINADCDLSRFILQPPVGISPPPPLQITDFKAHVIYPIPKRLLLTHLGNPFAKNTKIYTTKCLSPGTTKPKESEFKFQALRDFTAAGTDTIGKNWFTNFGNVRIYTKIFLRAVVIDFATGLASIPVEISCITQR